MKIRIKNNSIRIRLTRSETERFGKEKYLEEHTEFDDARFTYAIRSHEDVAEMTAELSNNKIMMHIPAARATAFVSTDAIGIQNDVRLANGNKLFLLLEKDLKCIDGEVLEDQSDNYENPAAICK